MKKTGTGKRSGLLQKGLIALIRLYQTRVSPLKGKPSCRFYPSCSRYAKQAVREWGVLHGSFFAVKRILRCHPFCDGGFDFVPRRHRLNGARAKRYRASEKDQTDSLFSILRNSPHSEKEQETT